MKPLNTILRLLRRLIAFVSKLQRKIKSFRSIFVLWAFLQRFSKAVQVLSSQRSRISSILTRPWNVKFLMSCNAQEPTVELITDEKRVTICPSSIPTSVYASPVAAQTSQDLGTANPYEILPAIHTRSLENSTELPSLQSPRRSITWDDMPARTSSPDQMVRSPTAKTVLTEMLMTTNPCFWAATPEDLSRYDRNATVAEDEEDFKIEPLSTVFDDPKVPEGWDHHTHPEGAPYFYHPSKRIYTDVDILHPPSMIALNKYIKQLESFMTAHSVHLDPHTTDLVLEPKNDEGEEKCSYYFVNHQTRSVFWLDEFSSTWFPSWKPGKTSVSHIGHAIEAQYWFHCFMFPLSLNLDNEIIDDLFDTLTFYTTDVITSLTSTAPYDRTDLQQMLSIANGIRKNDSHGPGTICSLSRLMNLFARQRYFDFHGLPHARLDRDRSVYDSPARKRSHLLTILSPFLFSAPDIHMKALTKIVVDGVVHETSWRPFIQKLNTEWQEFILYSTVLLNANVAFLAIQSLDSPEPQRTPAQVASYMSVVASVGSIILGLLLVRTNRTKTRETATDAINFLSLHAKRGMETLAVLYSLPYALLLWAMASFLAAISFMTFQATTMLVRLLVGAVWLAVAILVAWCIYTSWDSRPDENHSSSAVWVGPPVSPEDLNGSGDLNEKRQWRRRLSTLSMDGLFSRKSSLTLASEATAVIV